MIERSEPVWPTADDFVEFGLLSYITFVIIGLSIGVLGGFFGVGGAFILTPTLNILGLPMVNSVATGLAFTVGVSILAGSRHYRAGNVLIYVSLFVGLLSTFGLRLSAPLVMTLDSLGLAGPYIRTIYIVLLIALGLLIVRKKGDAEPSAGIGWSQRFRELPPRIPIAAGRSYSLWSLLAIALFVGFLQGLMGVGGGFILVPLFILVLDMEPHKAAGSSLGVILISSSFGTYVYLQSGAVLFVVAALLVAGTILGTYIGTLAVANIQGANLQRFYGFFLLLAAAGIVLQQLGLATLALGYMLGLTFIVTLTIVVRYYAGIHIPAVKKRPASRRP